jgi:NFU1 iron-sulfur cluster scaffold homolog, mitochondrial
MPFCVTEIQPTPNPNALKFMLDRPISEGPVSFLSADQARGHPLAQMLFAVPGVASLFLLGDFLTVNKTASATWPSIRKRVQQILAAA